MILGPRKKIQKTTIMKKRYTSCLFAATVFALVACTGVKVPEQYTTDNKLPAIYPDYVDVTIPVNIAPLAFEMDHQAEEMVARFSCGDAEFVWGGESVQPDEEEWKEMVEQSKGKEITVEVYASNDGQWTKYQPFHITVSNDSIDPYISYRLISPSYVAYEELTINQRCLEDYVESVIYDNMLCSKEDTGQCINCHNYQQYNPARMQFRKGGTVIAYDGKLSKVNMKNDSILSAGVYPAWHPWLPLIVYSTNRTEQVFHTKDHNKIEVYDAASDIISYNLDTNEVTNLENDPEEFEVFPAWAPDGKTLYYCSAHFEFPDTTEHSFQVIHRAKEVKYNLFKKDFDPETKQFGPRQMVLKADSMGMSATLPRVSPDGRFLMFTMGGYGVFHIWHRDADLWLLDLKNGELRNMEEINSDNTESYHSWSSNGRWVVFSSRRDDGGYTRPFIAHIDENGKGSKPFELPQASPDYHRQFLKSYNIPEFMKGPVTIKPQTFADVLKTEGTTVKYKPAKAKGE